MIYLIQNSKAYGQLEPFQQNLIINRKNRLQIEDAIVQARNIGYDKWAASSPMSKAWKAIVAEIVDIQVCESCEELHDVETMLIDEDANWFCQPCYTNLAPVMQQEYEVTDGNMSIKSLSGICRCQVSIEDLDGNCEMCGKFVD